ncbi:MAG TPA: response regulator [Alphaproteobacteria bacterium]
MSGRIFIVDDDRDHAESVADVLMLHGYSVEVAFTGEDGISRFRAEEFDIVLMDVRLPGMNGVETFFELKKIRPQARVLMMTGFSVEQLVAQAVENGALGVLHKPFAIADLLETLERVKPRGMVLVADDDPDFASSIEPILFRNGYVVEIACDGEEALRKASRPGLSCLILDLRMPMLSGLEVYLKLRAAATVLPTIFVTGFVGEECTTLAQVKEFTEGLLIKPFDPADLLRAVRAAVSSRQRDPAHAE